MPDDTRLVAQFLADVINPILVGLLAASGLRACRQEYGSILRCALGIVVAVLVAETGKRYQVWHGHPAFPSGHETLAVACATALLIRSRRWAAVVVPLSAAIGWALVRAGHHTPIEVIAGAATGAAFVTGFSAFPRRQARRAPMAAEAP